MQERGYKQITLNATLRRQCMLNCILLKFIHMQFRKPCSNARPEFFLIASGFGDIFQFLQKSLCNYDLPITHCCFLSVDATPEHLLDRGNFISYTYIYLYTMCTFSKNQVTLTYSLK